METQHIKICHRWNEQSLDPSVKYILLGWRLISESSFALVEFPNVVTDPLCFSTKYEASMRSLVLVALSAMNWRSASGLHRPYLPVLLRKGSPYLARQQRFCGREAAVLHSSALSRLKQPIQGKTKNICSH